jgi:ABC-type uncharacterized transport system permease subunit
METWSVLLWGAVGGAIPDILRLIRDRAGDVPTYLSKWWFWLGFVLALVVGALVAFIFAPAKILDAIAYGIAAPSILQGLAADRTKEPRLGADGNPVDAIRYWWSR